MQIWVDICHTPHVLLMAPLIREFERRGHFVRITARDCFQTCELLDLHHLKYQVVGKHYGGNKFLKSYGLLARTFQLILFARKYQFKLSFSSGSPYQAFASFVLRIAHIAINDYEQSSVFSLIRKIAHRLMFPKYISDESLERKGIDIKKVIKFNGLKEEIYLADFKPDPSVIEALKMNPERSIIIGFRSSANEAHYHNPKSELLMMKILDFLKAKSNVLIVIIPRGEKQKQQFMNYKKSDAVWKEKLIIPDSAIDTLSLLYYADLMIGGGGTMNREAVALGVPTYSFFCGPIGDVDQYLKNTGRLHFIATEEDIFKIEIRKKSEKKINFSKNGKLKEFIIKEIEACL